MTRAILVKVCGITSLVDAEAANDSGADYLGFILHPKSPRHVSLEKFRAMSRDLPNRLKVAVSVEPSRADLLAMRDAGFDRFQVHFRHDLSHRTLEAWSRAVSEENLWLAPKLPPSVDVSDSWMPLAECLLLDTFDPDVFGGTGRTGDWPKFKRQREKHPGKTWILSGGLTPANVDEALAESAAAFIDVNSGVESSPGIKDPAKLAAFFAAVQHPRR